MQKRNLKSLVPKKEKRKWYYWLNPLNYTPWRLYRSFLDEYFGYPEGVSTYYYYDTFPEIVEYDTHPKADVKELPPSRAKVREFSMKDLKKRRSFNLRFAMRRPKVSNGLTFDYAVKWVLLNLKRTVRLKEVNIKPKRNPQTRSYKDFNVKRRLRLKQINDEKMYVKDFASVTEEIVNIEPYLKSAKADKIAEIPMVKKQINKTYISQRSMEKIRSLLADTAKVKDSEVEIMGVYENFQYELYKGIKHNPSSGNISCFLDLNKKSIKVPKKPYLLIGKRRSDGKSFTMLADANKLAL